MKSFITLLFAFLGTTTAVSAQVEKPYFQIFDIADDTKSIKIETNDSIKIRKWNGTQLMFDMSIRLDGGTMDLLAVIIFDNRYAYEASKQGNNMLVKAKLLRRDMSKLKHAGNFCVEKVTTTLYVPDTFEQKNDREFIRKEDVIIASDKKK
jgi:hypothetical protein